MDGIYMTPISKFIEIALAISGLVILYFASKIFASNHAWGDGAEYEMLDLEPETTYSGAARSQATRSDAARSEAAHRVAVHTVDARGDIGAPSSAAVASDVHRHDDPAARGVVGVEDRIVRLGFTIALTYLAITWFGINSPAMWGLIAPVLYMGATAIIGRDPVYRRLRLTTKF